MTEPVATDPEDVRYTTSLQRNGEQFNQYSRGTEVGRGQHGKVYQGWDNHGNEVAIKVVKRTNPRADRIKTLRKRRFPSSPDHVPLTSNLNTTEQKIRKEIAIMRKCRHPHVVRLYEVIDDPLQKRIFMIMEYLGGGEVKWRKSPKNWEPTLNVEQARRITRDVVLGLEYLHHQGIIHRDIKPANLMWTRDRQTVKITDFGVSHFSYAQSLRAAKDGGPEDPILLDESDLSKTAGTPTFLAPEVVQDMTTESIAGGRSQSDISAAGTSADSTIRGRAGNVTKAIDIWALGVTLYCLLFGQAPHAEVTNEFALYNVIVKEDWEMPPTMGADRVPSGRRDRAPWGPKLAKTDGDLIGYLLDRLMDKDPRTRITLGDVKRYPWIIRDIPDPEKWLRETSPDPDAALSVTAEDARRAMTDVHFTWRNRIGKWLRGARGLRASKSSRSIEALSDFDMDQQDGYSSNHGRQFGSVRQKGADAKRALQDKGKTVLRPIVTRNETAPTPYATRRSQSAERPQSSTPRSKSRRGSESLLAPPKLDPRRSPISSTGGGWGSTSPTASISGESHSERPRNRMSLQAMTGAWPWVKKKISRGPGPHEASTSYAVSPASSGTTSPRSGYGHQEGRYRASPGALARRSEEAFSLLPSRRTQISQGMRPFGVGGGQLSAEMRASSWGEPQDYENHEDLLSVHSGDRLEIDEETMMYGAGGYATDTALNTPGPSPTLGPVSAIPAALMQRVSDDVATQPDPGMHDTGGFAHGPQTRRITSPSPLARITYDDSDDSDDVYSDADSEFDDSGSAEHDEEVPEEPPSSSAVYDDEDEDEEEEASDSDDEEPAPLEIKRRRPSVASALTSPPRFGSDDE